MIFIILRSSIGEDMLQCKRYFISIDATGFHIHPTLLAQSEMGNKVKSRSYTNWVKDECQCWNEAVDFLAIPLLWRRVPFLDQFPRNWRRLARGGQMLSPESLVKLQQLLSNIYTQTSLKIGPRTNRFKSIALLLQKANSRPCTHRDKNDRINLCYYNQSRSH